MKFMIQKAVFNSLAFKSLIRLLKSLTYFFFLSSGSGVHSPGQCLITFLPLFHAYGLIINMIAHTLGCKVVVMSRFGMDSYLELIQTYKVTSYIYSSLLVCLSRDRRKRTFS